MTEDELAQQIEELLYYFSDPEPAQKRKAIAGAGLDIPIWILGSSLFSALLDTLRRSYFAMHSPSIDQSLSLQTL